MNTQVAAASIRMQEWKQIIRDRKESGMTVQNYCAAHGLSKNQYYYWLRKIRERMIAQNPTVFAEITQPLQEPPKADCNRPAIPPITISRNHLTIGIREGDSRQLLQMVLEVTQDAE